jgi:hypothetical protein
MMVRMTDKPPKDNVIALKKRGRPPFQWTPEIENYILEKIVAGHSIRAIISLAQIGDYNGKPFPAFETIMAYVASNDEFQHKYTRAKDIQQDLMGETIIDIMDGRHPDFVNAELGQRKESAEIRKWVMGKLRRKKWGDVKVTELTGKDGTPLIQPQVIDTRSLPPEAQAALYQALQLIKAQQEAEDISHTEEST